MLDNRLARAAVAAGVGLTALSVLAPTAGADTVIYLGGTCACNTNSKGADTIANGYLATRGRTQGLPYAAGLNFPVTIPVGAQRLLAESATVDGPQVWSGVSQGALIIHDAELRLMALPPDQRPDKDQLSFVLIADEANPHNGILTKIPLLQAFVPVSDIETPYDTVSIAREYDGYADWPDRPNPLAVANAVMGIVYLHPDYEDVDITAPGTVVQETVNSQGGKTTHYVVRTEHLPLFQPVRDVEKAITGQNIVADTLDGLARPVIDSAYTRHDNDPTTARNAAKSTVTTLKADAKKAVAKARTDAKAQRAQARADAKKIRTEVKKHVKKIRDSISRKDNDNA